MSAFAGARIVPAQSARDAAAGEILPAALQGYRLSHLSSGMRIRFTKLSDQRHAVEIARADGTTERVELASREFIRHDLAHFVIESEVPLPAGYWGSVARGASLSGTGVEGPDALLAEQLAGRIQTLFRIDAAPAAYADLVDAFAPRLGTHPDLAARVHERIRQLRGRWRATPYGGHMELAWPSAAGKSAARRYAPR